MAGFSISCVELSDFDITDLVTELVSLLVLEANFHCVLVFHRNTSKYPKENYTSYEDRYFTNSLSKIHKMNV